MWYWESCRFNTGKPSFESRFGNFLTSLPTALAKPFKFASFLSFSRMDFLRCLHLACDLFSKSLAPRSAWTISRKFISPDAGGKFISTPKSTVAKMLCLFSPSLCALGRGFAHRCAHSLSSANTAHAMAGLRTPSETVFPPIPLNTFHSCFSR